MKKVFVLLALVAVGALVFAEDAPAPTYEFSASATGGWKYNLDTQQSTFINDWDLSLKYHLLNDIKKTKGADEGTYGYIEVTHLNLNLIEQKEDGSTVDYGTTTINNYGDRVGWGAGAGDGTGDNISVSAKIVSGPIEVGLYGAPGNNYENAKYVPLFEKDAGYLESTFAPNTNKTRDSAFKPELARSKGLSLKYTFGDFGFVQVLAANTAAVAAVTASTTYAVSDVVGTGTETVVAGVTYYDITGAIDAAPLVLGAPYTKVVATTVAAANAIDPKYLIGANIQIKPVTSDTLTVQIDGGFQTNLDTQDMIMTAKAAVTAGALSTSVAFDGGKPGASGSKFAYDAAANVAYALFEKKDSVNLDFYAFSPLEDSDVMSTELGLKYVDAEGLVPGLGFTAGFFWYDLLDNWKFDPKTIAFAESISYKYALSDTTYVKPYQALRMDLNDLVLAYAGYWDPAKNATWDKDTLYINFGVEAQLFPNCILTADYYKGQKHKDNNVNLVKLGDDSEISFKAKVTL
jgi:hypothetical protein